MNKSSKRVDLLWAFGINIIFFIIYTCVFTPLHESNDDIAISFMLEGVYGEASPYVVYQNFLWGKFVMLFYSLIPTVKWYMILMYLMLFLSFLSIVYVLLRVQGKKMGLVSSIALLLFCGYQSYVMFQYSRIAPMATAAGLVLLFYMIEHADEKMEKIVCCIVGVILAIWGSLIRFQMFAVAVVLVGGAIGLHRVWKIFRQKDADWLKQIGVYVVVFGTVGVLSLTAYVVDRVKYSSNETWNAYTKFNEVRTELWDYGFPDYYANQAAYQELGISQNDIVYYLSWNMDEEIMTTEYLQMIADLKPEKSFNVGAFLSIFPMNFLGIGVFLLFGLLSVLVIVLNWKNIYFVVFEFATIMAFEAYFFYINRYGIARVDWAMWMVALVALMYAISESFVKFQKKSWKVSVAMIVLVSALFTVDYARTPIVLDGTVGSSKEFYEEITEDKEHLYIMLSSSPRMYYAYDFWEPCEKGDLSNVYNAYGWEFNVPIKQAVRENYGIHNIYRDSINNENVYFATDIQYIQLQNYIQENYDANAILYYEKEVDGIPIWSVRTLDSFE